METNRTTSANFFFRFCRFSFFANLFMGYIRVKSLLVNKTHQKFAILQQFFTISERVSNVE